MDISTMDFRRGCNMGKRSLALDAKKSKGQELCRRNSEIPVVAAKRWPIDGGFTNGFTMIYL
jgi:hypothetical protein